MIFRFFPLGGQNLRKVVTVVTVVTGFFVIFNFLTFGSGESGLFNEFNCICDDFVTTL